MLLAKANKRFGEVVEDVISGKITEIEDEQVVLDAGQDPLSKSVSLPKKDDPKKYIKELNDEEKELFELFN